VTLLTQAPTGYPGDEPVGRYTVGVLRMLGYRARLHVVNPSQFGTAINDYATHRRSSPTRGSPITPPRRNGSRSSSAAPNGTRRHC
jgi:hypothetical protein